MHNSSYNYSEGKLIKPEALSQPVTALEVAADAEDQHVHNPTINIWYCITGLVANKNASGMLRSHNTLGNLTKNVES